MGVEGQENGKFLCDHGKGRQREAGEIPSVSSPLDRKTHMPLFFWTFCPGFLTVSGARQNGVFSLNSHTHWWKMSGPGQPLEHQIVMKSKCRVWSHGLRDLLTSSATLHSSQETGEAMGKRKGHHLPWRPERHEANEEVRIGHNRRLISLSIMVQISDSCSTWGVLWPLAHFRLPRVPAFRIMLFFFFDRLKWGNSSSHSLISDFRCGGERGFGTQKNRILLKRLSSSICH